MTLTDPALTADAVTLRVLLKYLLLRYYASYSIYIGTFENWGFQRRNFLRNFCLLGLPAPQLSSIFLPFSPPPQLLKKLSQKSDQGQRRHLRQVVSDGVAHVGWN